MGKWLMRLGMLTIAVSVLVIAGCPPQSEKEPAVSKPAAEVKPPAAAGATEEPKEKEPIPIEVSETLENLQPVATAIPEVKLTETLLETCRVKVGDGWPDGQVATLDGETVAVGTLLSETATVVFFWAAGESEMAAKTAALALADLQGDVQAAYADQGVAVLAINEQDSAETIRELLGDTEISYPVLLDDGAYFANVAENKLPRVYVLDGSGKIVWFDVEFSETSREVLKQALEVMLGEPAATGK